MPNRICLNSKNTLNINPLPPILAGPIVRRAEPDKIYVWVCTSKQLILGIQVYQGRLNVDNIPVPVIGKSPLIGQGFGQTVKVGENLYVTLLKANPLPETKFPRGKEVSYEIYVLKSEQNFHNATLLLDKKERSFITIDKSSSLSPSFCLQKDEYNDLRAAFGSCRKFHGEAEDMTVKLFEQAYAGKEASTRPNALFLLGDQIYADDVSDSIIDYIKSISIKIFGYIELLPNPDYIPFIEQPKKETSYERPKNEPANPYQLSPNVRPKIAVNQLDAVNVVVRASPVQTPTPKLQWINPRGIGTGKRQKSICDAANFTSTDGANHLAALAEYCIMYLLAFNDKMWNLGKSPTGEELERAKAGSEKMRRILANTPSYMMCDDHEITDDWNITNEWKISVLNNSLGRRIVTNGLCAYWMFQGWGNDPVSGDTRLAAFKGHAAHLLSRAFGKTEEKSIINSCTKDLRWTFVAPTTPPTLFLDTRFNRQCTPHDYFIKCYSLKEIAEMNSNLYVSEYGHIEYDRISENYSENIKIPYYRKEDCKKSSEIKDIDCVAPVLLARPQMEYVKKIIADYKHEKE